MTSKYLPSLDLQTFNYVENSDLFKKCLSNSFKRQVKHIAITVPKAKLLTINSLDLKREKNLWNNQHFFSCLHLKILAYWSLRSSV